MTGWLVTGGHKRRRWWLAGAAAAAGCTLLLWRVPAFRAEAPVPNPALPVITAAVRSAAVPAFHTQVALLALPRPAEQANRLAEPAVDCVVPLPVTAAGEASAEGSGVDLGGPTRLALDGLRRRLSALPGERSQAAVRYLELLQAEAAPAPVLAGLARLAATSADPQLYGLAWQMCGAPQLQPAVIGNAAVSACAMLNPAQWARLAPGNVRAHFAVAARARATGDAAGELDALRRATAASSFDEGIRWVDKLLYAALPADADEEGRIGVLVRTTVFRLASSFDGASVSINQACSAQALVDTNRQPVCVALARLLMRSDNLIDRAVGARVGERLGLPADVLKAVTRAMALTREAWFGEATGASCVGGTRLRRHLEDILAFGEIDAIQRAAERAGR